MHWQLIDSAQYDSLLRERLLPWAAPDRRIAYAVQDGSNLQLLTPLAETSDRSPLGVFTQDELQNLPAWRELLRFAPPHRVDLAAYLDDHPDYPVEIVFEAFTGRRPNFKTLAEFKEHADLDELSRELARKFDAPLNVLRLWNRLAPEERKAWLHLFTRRSLNRNFIRDIVLDYYDLDTEQRSRALAEARRMSEHWDQRPKSRSFPAHEVRDLVRRLRSPEIERLRKELLQLRRDLGLLKNMQLDLPDDLEQTRLTLRLVFDDVAELEGHLEKLSSPNFREGLQRIFDAL